MGSINRSFVSLRGLRNTKHWGIAKSFLVMCFIFLTSCSYFSDNDDNKKNSITTKKTNSKLNISIPEDCLNKFFASLPAFVKSEISSNDMDTRFGCIIDAVDLFKKYTKGGEENKYSAHEVRTFLNYYFFSERPLSKQDMRGIFNFKYLLLGGDKEKVSQSELLKIREFVVVLRKEFIGLEQYYPLLLGKKTLNDFNSIDSADEHFNKAYVELNLSLDKLMALFELPDNKVLIDEELSFFKYILYYRTLDVDRFFVALKAIKNILVRENDGYLSSSKVDITLRQLIDSLFVFLRYDLFLDDQKASLFSKDSSKHINLGLESVVEILSKAIQEQPNNKIKVSDITGAIELLLNAPFFPIDFDTSTINSFLVDVIFDIYLNGGKKNQTGEFSFLEKKHITNLKEFVDEWVVSSTALAEVFIKPELTRLEIVETVVKNAKASVEGEKDLGHLLFTLTKMNKFLKFVPDRFSLLIDYNLPEIDYSYEDVMKINMYRIVVMWVYKSYAVDEARLKSNYKDPGIVLLEEHLSSVYKDIRPLGIDIGLIDLRIEDVGSRSFLEASLFTSNSDGNEVLNQLEFMEFLALTLSVGETVDDQYYGFKDSGCTSSDYLDVFSREYIDVDCSSKWLQENFSSVYFNNHKLLEAHADEIVSDNYWDEFFNTWLGISRPFGALNNFYNNGDIRYINAIFSYLENLFTVYDKDQSEFLNRHEVVNAFPLFKSYIQNLAGGTGIYNPFAMNILGFANDPEGLTQVLFELLVRDQKIPDLNVLATYIELERNNEMSVTRLDFYRLFVLITRVNIENQVKAFTDHFKGFDTARVVDDFAGTSLKANQYKNNLLKQLDEPNGLVDELTSILNCRPLDHEKFIESLVNTIEDSDVFNQKSFNDHSFALNYLREFVLAMETDEFLKLRCQPVNFEQLLLEPEYEEGSAE